MNLARSSLRCSLIHAQNRKTNRLHRSRISDSTTLIHSISFAADAPDGIASPSSLSAALARISLAAARSLASLVCASTLLRLAAAPGAMARPRLSTGVPGYVVASPDSSTTAASLAAAADADPPTADPATFAELSPNAKSRILSAVAMKNPTTRDMMASGAAILATFAAPCTLASTTAPTGPPVVPMPR